MSDLQTDRTPLTRTYRHPLEIAPLVFGLVFLGVVAAWVLYATDVVSGSDAAWLLPAVLVGAGALGVVLAALRPTRPTPGYPGPPDASTSWRPQPYGEHTATAYDELMAQVPPPEVPPPSGLHEQPHPDHLDAETPDAETTDEPGTSTPTEHKERDDD